MSLVHRDCPRVHFFAPLLGGLIVTGLVSVTLLCNLDKFYLNNTLFIFGGFKNISYFCRTIT